MEPILLITRPAPAGVQFAATVAAGLDVPHRVLHAPALQITPLDYRMPDAAGVIFTSARAVSLAPMGAGLRAFCVGDATSAAATARGYSVMNAAGDADALVALILQHRPPGPLVHLGGRHRRGAIAERLTAAGVPCTTVVVYDQMRLPEGDLLREAASGDTPVVAPVFSLRSAGGVLALDWRAPLHVVAISAVVADAFAALAPARLLTVAHPDADHMVQMTRATLWGLSTLEGGAHAV
ncbi:uroporphyrinogen-III synthase [Loktanella fryxellensis]|uniref:Uroporphyrinogen-III synthase n=1 Tax=Loktanella fryxellensis TaxID=245187 RepID=A0A1H8E135_9RHOB|nr:uroporphyrinogen-III synthase [Loktanella fryxellensis]SEN12804.1 uroporphyrinogen-III synthase [Loktanella fryxellensis]